MGYNVIHMIEAADWLEELEYFRLVEQCRQTYRFLAETDRCTEQVCMIFSDKVKTIKTEPGSWPGETAFRRPKNRKKIEHEKQRVCFEEALYEAAEHMNVGGEWIIILYTGGAVRRSKRTMIGKWKKALKVRPTLLAIQSDQADTVFLESYTEEAHIFSVEEQGCLIQWLEKYGKNPEETVGKTTKNQKSAEKSEELWKIIRDCFV